MWVAGKLCDPSLAGAIPERFKDEFLMIKRYTDLYLTYFTCIRVVSDIAIFVLKRDVKLQLTNL